MTDTRTDNRVLELTDDGPESIAIMTSGAQTTSSPTTLVLPDAGSTAPTIDLRAPLGQADQTDRDTLFDRFEALSFADVVVVPRDSEVVPGNVNLQSLLARGVTLRSPVVVSSPVCNAAMAIAVARSGAIAIIPGNMGVTTQVATITRVKQVHRGWISGPVTLSHDATIADAQSSWLTHGISGAPVVDALGRLIGMLTKRDLRFCTSSDSGRSVREFMTQSHALVTAPEGTSIKEARLLMSTNRVEKLPMTDAHGRLVGLLTVRDLLTAEAFADATLDHAGALRVAASVGAGPDLVSRVDAVVAAGVDAVVINHPDGSFSGIAWSVTEVRKAWPNLPIIAGNVSTSEGVRALHDAGADALIVGDSKQNGVGTPLLTRLNDTKIAAVELGVPLIAAGATQSPGNLLKALAVGASTVLLDPTTLSGPTATAAPTVEAALHQIGRGLQSGIAAAGADSIPSLHANASLMRVTAVTRTDD
jgi:IMP dehydrogenase